MSNNLEAYRFCIVIEGHGQNKQEAWNRAVRSFRDNPGTPPVDLNALPLVPSPEAVIEHGKEYTENITEAFREGRLG